MRETRLPGDSHDPCRTHALLLPSVRKNGDNRTCLGCYLHDERMPTKAGSNEEGVHARKHLEKLAKKIHTH